jgi:hypothetical protein
VYKRIKIEIRCMLLSFHLQGEAVYLFRLQKYIKKMNSVTNRGKKKVKTSVLSSVTLNPYRLSAMPKSTPSCLTGNTKKTGRRNPCRLANGTSGIPGTPPTEYVW